MKSGNEVVVISWLILYFLDIFYGTGFFTLHPLDLCPGEVYTFYVSVYILGFTAAPLPAIAGRMPPAIDYIKGRRTR